MELKTLDFSRDALNDLSDYFHAAPVGLYLTESDGTIKRTNLAELELLGCAEDEMVGHHMAEFHANSHAVQSLLNRLVLGETVAEEEAILVRRDGNTQKVLMYANPRVENGDFAGIRCVTFPHPDDPRPDIAEVGALIDTSIEVRNVELDVDEQGTMYTELRDFFENSPVSLHIVGGDGLIKYASKSELASMGYDKDSYVGAHIARFHADQAVIDGMLEDLVGGTPLINFAATLSHKDGSKLPVMIYSNSRMRNGSFVNTRCFTVPVPRAGQAVADATVTFTWPRNEDFGFMIPGREQPAGLPDPMTMALKYIASRKRPEESLGFLARVSLALGRNVELKVMIDEVARLCVPFLADHVSLDLESVHLADASISSFRKHSDAIMGHLKDTRRHSGHSLAAVLSSGHTLAALDLSGDGSADNRALQELGARSMVITPLTTRGRAVGTGTFVRENAATRRDFGPADVALVEELARRIGFAIEIDQLARHV